MVKLREGTYRETGGQPRQSAFPRAGRPCPGAPASRWWCWSCSCCSAVFAPLVAPHDPLEDLRRAPGPQLRVPLRHRRQGPRRAVAHDLRRAVLADHRPVGHGAAPWCAAPSSGPSPPWRARVSPRSSCACLDVIMSFPGIALAGRVRGGVRQLAALAHLRHRLFVHTADRARGQCANVVSEYGQDYVRAVVVSGARAPWILVKHVMRNCIAPVHGVHHRAGGRRHRVRGVAVVHRGRHPRADAHVGQHPGRRPRRRARPASWWQALVPGPGHHPHGAVRSTSSPRASPTPWPPRPRAPVKAERLRCQHRPRGRPPRGRPDAGLQGPGGDAREAPGAAEATTELTRTDRFEAHTDVPPILEVQGPVHQVPAPRRRERGRPRELRGSSRARPWAWWASPAAASPSPRWPSWGCSTRRPRSPARSSTRARTC